MKIITIFLSLNIFYCYGNDNLEQFLKDKWQLSKTQMKYLNSGEILADSIVES